ncbi:SprT family zinc-dependent metalloprotease [Acetobacter suratthaniensis]|nr:SprT family zinc-dependent metalloprotease [Acetobacter suratthaniensis]MCX2566035.1 SprT family zinc-dependent metalloprotease [Acetobacter suratthaniensis]
MSHGPASLPLPNNIDIDPVGTLPVIWRVSKQARRLSMRLAPRQNAVTVTLPATCPPATALAFLHNNRNWLAGRLRRVQNAFSFTPDSVIPVEGHPHRIVHSPDKRGGAWIENGQIIVCGESAFITRRVIDCLRHHAARVLGAELQAMAKTAGLKPTRLDIRDPTSRWGSCSTTGRIMLSWRLIMAPPEVRHYLIAHELSHLLHMDHSNQFWQQVKRLTPHRQQAEAWLRHHGPTLMRAGQQELPLT